MPATLLVSLLAQFGPVLAEKLTTLYHNGGELTRDECMQYLAMVKKDAAEYLAEALAAKNKTS